jgi:hypothetical protein
LVLDRLRSTHMLFSSSAFYLLMKEILVPTFVS